MILEKYALPNLIKEYNDNKDRIHEYFRSHPREGYNYRGASDNTGDNETLILGLGITVFMTLLLISLALWILAIYMLVTNWDKLEDWAKIVAVLGILFGFVGPIVTIVVVLIGKKTKRKN